MNRSIPLYALITIFIAACAGTETATIGNRQPLANVAAYGLDQAVNVQASISQAEEAKTRGIDLPVGNYLPTKKVAPAYPRKAMSRGKTGWVLVAYTVTESGELEDIRIVDEYPAGLFSESALSATAKFEFAPYLEQGAPTPIPNAWNLFTYEYSR